MNKMLIELKQKCVDDKIPLARDQTIKLIADLINKNNFKSYLEIGTAYGYSAFYVGVNTKLEKIETIEKDKNRFEIAKTFLRHLNFVKQHLEDCLTWNTKNEFDFIFVDGPKSQQISIVNKYLSFLKQNGIMFIDNIELKDIRNIENKTKNQIKIIQKVEEFKKFLISNNDINVEFLDIDDGIAVVTKK